MNDLVKQAEEEIQSILVREADYINRTIQFITAITTEVKFLKKYYSDYILNLVWTVGVLNSEVHNFRTTFIDGGGIKAVLLVSEFFSDLSNGMDDDNYDDSLECMAYELEQMITFTLTSCVYDDEEEMEEDSFDGAFIGGKNYETFKPIMIYL